jgi:hypothetical protein
MIVAAGVELFEFWAEMVLLERFVMDLFSPPSSWAPAR